MVTVSVNCCSCVSDTSFKDVSDFQFFKCWQWLIHRCANAWNSCTQWNGVLWDASPSCQPIASHSTEGNTRQSRTQASCRSPENNHCRHLPLVKAWAMVILGAGVWEGALTLLVGRQEGHPACKNWAVGCWCGYLSEARCRLAYVPANATATHCLLLQ